MTIGRAAILTQPHNGRAALPLLRPVRARLRHGSYFNSLGATLPAARKTGNLTLATGSVVAEVLYDAKTDRATGVRVIDATHEADARVLARASSFSARRRSAVAHAAAELEERALS